MANIELGNVIASRRLDLPDEQGIITVLIGTPQQSAEHDFIAPYRILGAGDEKIRFAAGIDPDIGERLPVTSLESSTIQEKAVPWTKQLSVLGIS
jgi:hypothetical protein